MTVKDIYGKLEKLISDGHGDKKIGYFDEEYNHLFVEITDILPAGDDDYGEIVEVR